MIAKSSSGVTLLTGLSSSPWNTRVSTPRLAETTRALSARATSGSRQDRNALVSSRSVASATIARIAGTEPTTTLSKSMPWAVAPVTAVLTPPPTAGGTSRRRARINVCAAVLSGSAFVRTTIRATRWPPSDVHSCPKAADAWAGSPLRLPSTACCSAAEGRPSVATDCTEEAWDWPFAIFWAERTAASSCLLSGEVSTTWIGKSPSVPMFLRSRSMP